MTTHPDLDVREALAGRLVDDTSHALETLSVCVGLELGRYQALADLGSATEPATTRPARRKSGATSD
jgi:hypothetical protein